MFNPADETFQVKRANSAADLEAAYRMVHDVFADMGYINHQRDGMRLRVFEAVPETATFICKHNEEIVAVMSVVVDSPDMGLPSNHAFEREINTLRKQGRRVCEFTNLAVKKEYWRSNAFTALTQACHAHAKLNNCDNIFIAISPGHTAFFESILGFDKCGESRNYSHEKSDIVQGECLDLRTIASRFQAMDRKLGEQAFLYDYYFANNYFDKVIKKWSSPATVNLHNARKFCFLLTKRSNFLLTCDWHELAVIRDHWGSWLFRELFGDHWEGDPKPLPPALNLGSFPTRHAMGR